MGKVAAHETTVRYSSDDSTYEDIEGMNSVSFSTEREELEVTDFDNPEQARDRIMGLKDYSVSMDGHYQSGGQQDELRSELDDGATNDSVFIEILWDGEAGIKIELIPTGYDIDADHDSTVEASFELESTDTPEQVTS